jgi:hypothetical protein
MFESAGITDECNSLSMAFVEINSLPFLMGKLLFA